MRRLDSVLRIAPGLEVLHIAGGAIRLDALTHPRLRELVLETDALPAETARAVANAELPECTRLVVYFGMSDADLGPLWTGAGLAKLAHLGLVNATFDDALVPTIAGAQCSPGSRQRVLPNVVVADQRDPYASMVAPPRVCDRPRSRPACSR